MKHTYIFTSSPVMDDHLPSLVRVGNQAHVSMRYVGLLSGLSSVQFFTDANTMHEIAYAAGLPGYLLRTEIPAARRRGDAAVGRAQESLDAARKNLKRVQDDIKENGRVSDTDMIEWIEKNKALFCYNSGGAHVAYFGPGGASALPVAHFYGVNFRDVVQLAMRQTENTLKLDAIDRKRAEEKRALNPGGTKRSKRSA